MRARSILVGIVVGAVVIGCGGPSPSRSPTGPVSTASPSASAAAVLPSARPSASPSPGPSAQPAAERTDPPAKADPPLGPKPGFRSGDLVMTVTDDIRVRSKPRVAADSKRYDPLLRYGSDLLILDGPVSGSGYWWYRVHLEDGLELRGGITTGWVAAADHDGEPWIADPDEAGLYECCDAEPGAEPYEPEDLPVPTIEFIGIDEDVPNADAFRWDLSVTNWDAYPDDLFEEDPDFGRCVYGGYGRLQVDIVAVDTDEPLGGTCRVAAASELADLWFDLPRDATPPTTVAVSIVDRLGEWNAAYGEVAIPEELLVDPESSD